MRIAARELRPFAFPLVRPLDTGAGRLSRREGVLLVLEDGEGHRGLGEASPLPGFHREGVAECLGALDGALDASWCRSDRGLDERLEEGRVRLSRWPTARAALDGALHDLAARRAGIRVADLLAGPQGVRPRVAVHALLSGRRPEDLVRAARRARAAGFPACKLKLLGDADDLHRVAAVRRALGDGVSLRLDANGALDPGTARRLLERLASYAIEWIEQPLAPGHLAESARLRRDSSIPIAADEDAVDEARVAAVLEQGAADWIVLKPAACGGLAAAWSLAERARAAGLGVVVTSFLDGAVGRRGALHLAAALPGPLPACGLATGSWLAQDWDRDPEPEAGALALSQEPGLGVTLPEGPAAAETARC